MHEGGGNVCGGRSNSEVTGARRRVVSQHHRRGRNIIRPSDQTRDARYRSAIQYQISTGPAATSPKEVYFCAGVVSGSARAKRDGRHLTAAYRCSSLGAGSASGGESDAPSAGTDGNLGSHCCSVDNFEGTRE